MSALIRTEERYISGLDLSGGGPLDEANVAAIRAGLLDGQETPPIAVDEGGQVLWGFHRVEAHKRAGRESIRCDVMAFASPEAQEAAVISENLRRRHLDKAERDRLLARYVGLIQKRIESQSAIDPQVADQTAARKPGRQGSPRRQAIKEAAAHLPHSEDTVERAVKAQQEAADPEPTEPSEPEPPPVLRSFGVPIPPGIAAKAKCAQELIDKADGHLRALSALIGKLDGLVPGSVYQRLEQQRSALAFALRGARPEWICIWCKDREDLIAGCKTCNQPQAMQGMTLASSIDGDHPKELLREGPEAMVMVGKNMAPYAKPAKPGKKVKIIITGLDGQEREFSPENPPPPDDEDLAF